jgi:hypothetical protein
MILGQSSPEELRMCVFSLEASICGIKLDIFFFLSVENHRKKDDEVVAERSLWV